MPATRSWPHDQDLSSVPIDAWEGEFGDDYTARNEGLPLGPRIKLWHQIWREMGGAPPRHVLEVGANVGANIEAIRSFALNASLVAIEPNAYALETMQHKGIRCYAGQAQQLDFPSDSFDLVFTSGVLIHISPEGKRGLKAACQEIARVSKRWVVAIEYFSAQPRSVTYRDRKGLLWLRDFGQFYMETCGLVPVACGFAWKPLTGLDNVTWWLLRKPDQKET